jgi:hypothetical protein
MFIKNIPENFEIPIAVGSVTHAKEMVSWKLPNYICVVKEMVAKLTDY